MKFDLDADLLKVLKRIPYKVGIVKAGLNFDRVILVLTKESALQGMKL